MKSYSTSIAVTASPNEVFKHITDVPKWWIREAAGAITEFEGKSSNFNDEFMLRHVGVHPSHDCDSAKRLVEMEFLKF